MANTVDSEKELQDPYAAPLPKDVGHSLPDIETDSSSDHIDDDHGGVDPASEPPSEEPDSSADQPDNQPKYSVFTLWEKRILVLAASLSAFFSPLTAQIYLPALPVLAEDFHVSQSSINLTVTTYMIFQGVTPMFIGGLADTAGRRPAYLICFIVYIAANIGLALSKNYASMLVVRCIQSAGSSTTVALCQAVVADIITSAERGQYVGITVIPIVLAPSLGPILGGLFTQYLGWRSIFWFLAIAAAVDFVAMLFFFPETCRRIVGDGSQTPPRVYRTFWQMIKSARRKRRSTKSTGTDLVRTSSTATSGSRAPSFHFVAPNLLGSIILLCQKELSLLLFYSGIVLAGFYAVAAAMPSQLTAMYGLTNLQVGLMYLPMAGGSIVAAFVIGPSLNRNYRRHAALLGRPVDSTRQMDLTDFPIERARLEVGLPLLALSAAAMLCWGWAFEKEVHLAVPCVLLFLMGLGMIGFNNAASVLIIDIYPGRAGAAVAASNLVRCTLGAASSAAIVPMIDGIGNGFAYLIFGLMYVVFSPLLFLVIKKGIRWRAEMAEAEERKKQKKDAREKGDENQGTQDRTRPIGDADGEHQRNKDLEA